jgi:hypothetical protein
VSKKVNCINLFGPSYFGSANYLPIFLASEFAIKSGLMPTYTGLELVKYTSGAGIYRYADYQRLRSLSNYIHRQRRANAPVSFQQALNQVAMRPAYFSSESSDILTEFVLSQKYVRSKYPSLFNLDLNKSIELRNFVNNIIVAIPRSTVNNRSLWSKIVSDFRIKVIIQEPRAHNHDVYYERDVYNSHILNLFRLDNEGARNLIGPALGGLSPTTAKSLLNRLVPVEAIDRYSRQSVPKLYSEEPLEKIIKALNAEGISGIDDNELLPSNAPLDANVVEGVLSLSGQCLPKTTTPLESLDELRAEYARDVSRLRRQLAGSNAGEGFLSRLEAVERRLNQPLSESSSLVLATQVRALEDMLSPLQDLLSDITIADVGATVSALGIYVRQFESWRSFLEIAKDTIEFSDDYLSDINSLADLIINESQGAIDFELKEGLSDVKNASNITNDVALRLGLASSTNNTYKAIARYLTEFSRTFGSTYTSSLASKLGEALSNLTLAGIMLGGSQALMSLAASDPHQFGWVYGLVVWLSVSVGKTASKN